MKINTKALNLNGVLEKNLVMKDISKGNIKIENAEFLLLGIHTGDIHCYSNSKVRINGILNGNIFNFDGIVEINGMMNGKIETFNGQTFIHHQAVISSK